jgi:hypothetical protein
VIRAISARTLPPADGVALLSSSDFASGAALVKRLAGQHSDWKRRLLVGPFALAYDQGLVAAITARGGGVVAASSMAPESFSPAVRSYMRAYAKAFGSHPPGRALDTFAVPYEVAMQALVQAVQAVHGSLGDGRLAFRRALTRVVLDGPEGRVALDARRQAIATNYLVRIGSPMRLVAAVPRVDQEFGGLFSPAGPPPSATNPVCRPARSPAWAARVTAAASR